MRCMRCIYDLNKYCKVHRKIKNIRVYTVMKEKTMNKIRLYKELETGSIIPH